MFRIIYVIVLIIAFNNADVESRIHGKLLSSEQADKLFGPVKESVSISSSELKNFISKNSDVIMFQIFNSKLVVLGEDRSLVYSSGLAAYSETDTFIMYSSSMVAELIEKGKSNQTFVQKRDKVLTVTNGDVTLEYGTSCPPWCD